MVPDFPCLADGIAEPRPDMSIKVAAFTVSEKSINTYSYYIPINDTSFGLSVFWPSDTERRINKLRFSDSISLSFKGQGSCRLPVFAATLHRVNFKHGNRDGKHDDVT